MQKFPNTAEENQGKIATEKYKKNSAKLVSLHNQWLSSKINPEAVKSQRLQSQISEVAAAIKTTSHLAQTFTTSFDKCTMPQSVDS